MNLDVNFPGGDISKNLKIEKNFIYDRWIEHRNFWRDRKSLIIYYGNYTLCKLGFHLKCYEFTPPPPQRDVLNCLFLNNAGLGRERDREVTFDSCSWEKYYGPKNS